MFLDDRSTTFLFIAHSSSHSMMAFLDTQMTQAGILVYLECVLRPFNGRKPHLENNNSQKCINYRRCKDWSRIRRGSKDGWDSLFLHRLAPCSELMNSLSTWRHFPTFSFSLSLSPSIFAPVSVFGYFAVHVPVCPSIAGFLFDPLSLYPLLPLYLSVSLSQPLCLPLYLSVPLSQVLSLSTFSYLFLVWTPSERTVSVSLWVTLK